MSKILSLIIILIIAIAGWFLWFQPSTNNILEQLPNPDTNSIEKQVAAKLASLRQRVQENPQSGTAWGKYAMNLDVHDFKKQALFCYQQAIEFAPKEFRWPYYYAILLNERGLPDAIKWFENSLTLNPSYAPALVRLGQALQNAGRNEAAKHAFERSLQGEKKLAQGFIGLAQIALAENDLEASRKYLIDAATIASGQGEIYSLLGEVYRRLKEFDKAKKMQRCARYLPKTIPLYDLIYTELQAEGESSFWYFAHGKAFLAKGLYKEAAAKFRIALKTRQDAEIHDALGIALQRMGKLDEAQEQHLAALNIYPNYPEALNNLATLFFRKGDIENAIEFGKQAVQSNPRFWEAYFNLGVFYEENKQLERAVFTFREGLSFSPENPRLSLKLAWILATATKSELRNGKEAIALAETVCEDTDWQSPETLDVLAAAYAEDKQFRLAIQTAQQAKQLALQNGQTDLANQINERLIFYQANKTALYEKFN